MLNVKFNYLIAALFARRLVGCRRRVNGSTAEVEVLATVTCSKPGEFKKIVGMKVT